MVRLNPLLQVLLLLVAAFQISPGSAHGFLSYPFCRGTLNSKSKQFGIGVFDPSAPIWAQDTKIFFPAGDRSVEENAAVRSQKRAVGFKWVPFEPLKRDFKWRAGICGDMLGKPDHLRGGRFYWPRNALIPRITKVYRPGGLLDAQLRIVGHHHGFMEFHLCDVTKCPRGDISPECFRRGHCVQLQRAPNKECDSGASRRCGPIDRNYRGRWYVPCSVPNTDAKWETYGPGTMLYRIPHTFRSRHAVLHWYWAAGNKCNANGVLDYFDGPDKPWGWGKCPGQAGALGGVSRVQPECGGEKFPEDYYACADVAVVGEPVGKATGKNPPPPQKPMKKAPPPSSGIRPQLIKRKQGPFVPAGSSDILGLFVVSRGIVMNRLESGDVIVGTTLPQMTFEAATKASVRFVTFTISVDGTGRTWSSFVPNRPFRMFASRRYPKYWAGVVYGKSITVTLSTSRSRRKFVIKFVRQ